MIGQTPGLTTERVRMMLQAQSIAVVGATDRPGHGRQVIENLLTAGFEGDLYLVNPTRSTVAGRPTHPSLEAIGSPVDLVVAAVNRESTLSVVTAAAAMGCGSAVLLAAGFGETGESGREMQRELVQAKGSMVLQGPNCLGFVNLEHRIAPYSGPLMEPPEPGPVALVSNSGALACTLTGAAAERGISLGYVITTGNQADLGLGDFVRYLASRPLIRVIACYVEGFLDGRQLLASLRAAREAGKTVVLLKGGRSASGAEAAKTHTGSLAGSSAVQAALFADEGVMMARDTEELLALVELNVRLGPTAGPRLGVVTISGGEGLLAADAFDDVGIRVASLSPETVTQLRDVLPSYAVPTNPLDTTGAGIVEGNTGVHQEGARLLALDPNVDILLACQDAKNGWVHSARTSDIFLSGITAAHRAATGAGKPLVVLSPSAGEIDARARAYLLENAIPFLAGLQPAAKALAQILQERHGAPPPRPQSPPVAPGTADGTRLTGLASLERLKAAGVSTWPTQIARSETEAVHLAGEFGYPVVLKVDGAIAHRTEIGGVRVGLGDEMAVRDAWKSLTDRTAATGVDLDGMLVQPMAPGGLELFVGGLCDPQFGPIVLFGMGGVLVEYLADVAVALAPMTDADARRLMGASRTARLLKGWRGTAGPDLDALAAALVGISEVVAEPDINALDINPLIASPQGVALVDAKIVLRAAG